MAQNVKFISVKLQSTYNALEVKDSLALYWIQETQRLYKGDKLYGTGLEATADFAGLMSAKDKAALDALIAADNGLSSLTAIDGTMKIVDTEDGGKSIGVSIASDPGNALVAVEGGLFVPTVIIPEYAIEKQSTAEEGFVATYKLKKTVGEEVSYVGDAINIAKDLVLQSATLETVTENGVPYAEAKVGDPYIKMTFNNAETSDLYIPVKGLVDTYTSGSGIEIVGNEIGVKISLMEDNALRFVDGALYVAPGMSDEEKEIFDSIPETYASKAEMEVAIAKVIEEAQPTWEDLDSNVGVAKIGNTYYATVQKAIAAANVGDTVKIMAGNYGMIEFTDATKSNITLLGEDGVRVNKIRLIDTANYGAPDGLTLKNITFDGVGIIANDDEINNMSVVDCDFVNGAVVHIGDCITNGLIIEKCEFEATNSAVNLKEKTAILVQGTSKNVIIRDNKIKDCEHNAIQVVGASGSMLIDSNIIDNTGSRAMRITTKDGAVLAIMNNIITNVNTNPVEAEENAGEIIKITGSIVDGAITNNIYNGNELVFNAGIGQVI